MDGRLTPQQLALADPTVQRIAAALRGHFGDRLARLVLYGSRARGDHRPDSDYDVAAFLAGEVDRAAEMERLLDLEAALMDETGAAVQVFPFPLAARDDQTLFMHFLRADGVEL